MKQKSNQEQIKSSKEQNKWTTTINNEAAINKWQVMITGTMHNIHNIYKSRVSLLNRLKCDRPGIAQS
jgi:nitrous oxide reductase